MKKEMIRLAAGSVAVLSALASSAGAQVELSPVDIMAVAGTEGLELVGGFSAEPDEVRVELGVSGFDPAAFELVEEIDEGETIISAALDMPINFVVMRGADTLMEVTAAEILFEADALGNAGLGTAAAGLRSRPGDVDLDDSLSTAYEGIAEGDEIQAYQDGALLFSALWGIPVEPPVEPPPALELIVSPVGAGGINTFTANGGNEGDLIAFLFGFQPGPNTLFAGPCRVNGIALEILDPRFLGISRTVGGTAGLDLFVPGGLAGVGLHAQAVNAATCETSNLVSSTL